jgi:hypothetical protein
MLHRNDAVVAPRGKSTGLTPHRVMCARHCAALVDAKISDDTRDHTTKDQTYSRRLISAWGNFSFPMIVLTKLMEQDIRTLVTPM